MIRWGVKGIATKAYEIGKRDGSDCLKTERGFEKWIAIDNTIGNYPVKPALSFENINDAFIYKAAKRMDSLQCYFVIEELE